MFENGLKLNLIDYISNIFTQFLEDPLIGVQLDFTWDLHEKPFVDESFAGQVVFRRGCYEYFENLE